MTNRRFGTANTFGTTNTFGASSGLTGRIFVFEVDWDNDHFYNGANEFSNANRLMKYELRRGREFFFNSGGDGFQPVNTGELTLTLKNIDRRYDPYYVGGELFDALQKNPMCRFRLYDNDTSTMHNIFAGYIDDIRPHYSTVDTVDIIIKDGIKKLKEKNISSTEVYATVQYDNQIDLALSRAGWLDGRDIDTTLSDSMTYHWFRGNSAFSEITSLVDATFGLFFISKDGSATYKSRISSDASVLTLTEADIDYGYKIRAPSPRDVVRNNIKVYARARTSQSNVEVWRMIDTPLITTGTGSPIWANYKYNDEEVPVTSVTEPVATTDYTANANADGGGTDYTANFSFAREGFATSSKLTPSNSGSSGYITLLKIRGTAITADKYTFATARDQTSIDTYSERELTINSDWLQDVNAAQEQADLLLDRFSVLRFFPRVQLKKEDIANQLTFDLFDLVTVNFVSKGVTGEMRVGFIESSWDIHSPNTMNTVIYLEPNLTISASGAWIFPITFPATLG